MKKIFALLLAVVMTLGLLAGCGTAAETPDTEAPATEAPAAEEPAAEPTAKKIDTLKVAFVPSREPQEIITVTEPLKEMLKNELATLGYEVGEVEITVGTTYEAVGEGLEAGTIDVGLIPGGTYVLYDDGAEVILTATRDGLSKDSDNAKDWNDGQPTEASDRQAVSYRALFIAGPSEKGKELQDKVNAGEELTWEDLDGANWSVMGTSSPAGYIYPALWLQDHYGKGISDLSSAVQSDSYASAFARLASGQVDVLRCHDLDMLVACRHDRHEIPHLVVRYHRRRLRLPIHDVADRQGGAGLDLLQAQGRSADEQQVVDERLPDLARPLPVCPPGEVHRDIALHADAVQIALYEHLAAVGDAQCVPALFVFRIFSHGHTLGTPPHGCGCQSMK